MNIKESILYNVTMTDEKFLLEMAAEDLAKVMPEIKAGNYEKAAKDYVDLMQAKKKSVTAAGISKTLNSYMAKLELADKTAMEPKMAEFRKALTTVKRTEGVVDNRPEKYNKAPTEVQVRSKGEVTTQKIAKSGLKQGARKENITDRIVKEAELVKKELELLKVAGDDAALFKLAKEIATDLSGQKPPKDSTEEEVEKDIKVLKNFVNTGAGKAQAVEVMKDIVNQGYHNYEIFHQVVSNLSHVKPRSPETEKKIVDIQKIINAKKLIKGGHTAEIEGGKETKKLAAEEDELEDQNEDNDMLSKAKKNFNCPYCNKEVVINEDVGSWSGVKMHYSCFMKKFRESYKGKGK